jgi:FMN-dependent oxidoreductase (nitrilotriacetate monooxygenase family)
MFFDDRLAMPGVYGGSVADAVRLGARPVKLDLSVVLGVVAAATRSIGLGATYSTTYYSPFHVARTFATLDHLSGGRAAWNVVTSVNDSEAQNFGFGGQLDHDVRYDRADEFLEATTGLWDTWEDDALVLDRAAGVFADPDKVHELNYQGEWFHVRGPLTVPRSPQGRPVLLQAGSSGRGRDFAARWAELIFTGDPDVDVARSHYKDQKERIAHVGRDPDQVRMLPMAYTVVGESAAQAQEREQLFLNQLVDPRASLALLSELMNYDFSPLDLNAPITDELIASVSGIRGLVQNLRQHIGGETITLADLAGHRATLLQGPRFVGTGRDVADQMQRWFEADACDGFVIAATHVPGAYEDVVRLVVPELQRRGLFRDHYTGQTLREHLGLARPAARHIPAPTDHA